MPFAIVVSATALQPGQEAPWRTIFTSIITECGHSILIWEVPCSCQVSRIV